MNILAMGLVACVHVRENILLSMLLRHLARFVRRYTPVKVFWIKGHSSDPGNDIADSIADEGVLVLLDFERSKVKVRVRDHAQWRPESA